MVEKHGTWPANARVDVDYSKGKPKIKFTYPKNGDSGKKQALKQNHFGPHIFILIIILASVVCYPIISQEYVSYPQECNISEDAYKTNKTIINHILDTKINLDYKIIYGYNITCGNEIYKIKFNNMNSFIIPTGFESNNVSTRNIIQYSFLWLILPFTLFFIINRLLSRFLIKQKWYQKWLPKHNAGGKRRSKKYVKFIPEDVENNMVEIPLFSNVELDYKTEGDFSDKLEKIKIREHQYNKYKNGKVGKKKIDMFKWHARFYFKTKPKNGYLEVIFQ